MQKAGLAQERLICNNQRVAHGSRIYNVQGEPTGHPLRAGNQNVILCERGIRTFETATRNTLDLSSVPVLKNLTHLPIVVDPSHGVGKMELVAPMAKAAVAVGADGLIIEVHTNPEEALSDGEQSLRPHDFRKLIKELKPIAAAVGREI